MYAFQNVKHKTPVGEDSIKDAEIHKGLAQLFTQCMWKGELLQNVCIRIEIRIKLYNKNLITLSFLSSIYKLIMNLQTSKQWKLRTDTQTDKLYGKLHNKPFTSSKSNEKKFRI